MENKRSVKWVWLPNDNADWVVLPPKSCEEIEEEYQKELLGKRIVSRVFHCFGSGRSSAINYRKMETYCSSGKCFTSHVRNELPDNHMTFKIGRIE